MSSKKDIKIKKYYSTEEEGLEYALVNLKLIEDSCEFNSTSSEAELESVMNQVLSMSACNHLVFSKQKYSDGFHYYIDDEGDIRFKFITEYKMTNMTTSRLYDAFLQAVFYYFIGLKQHQSDDMVKYIIVGFYDYLIVFKLESIVPEILNIISNYREYEDSGRKLTGSMKKSSLLDSDVSYILKKKGHHTFERTGEGIKDLMKYILEDFEIKLYGK